MCGGGKISSKNMIRSICLRLSGDRLFISSVYLSHPKNSSIRSPMDTPNRRVFWYNVF